jgi:RNA polymerase-binding transcription factor DksA
LNTSPSRSLPSKLTAAHRTRLRARLESDLSDLIDSQRKLHADIAIALESRRGVGTNEAEDPEGGSLAFEQAQTRAVLNQSERHQAEIGAALARMDAGTYGSCIQCERPIAVGRLDARPSTAHCIACAS